MYFPWSSEGKATKWIEIFSKAVTILQNIYETFLYDSEKIAEYLKNNLDANDLEIMKAPSELNLPHFKP